MRRRRRSSRGPARWRCQLTATGASSPFSAVPMSRTTLREAAAEFFGTFILIMFGVGVVAQVVLSGRTAGDYLSINIGWGLAVTMGVYVAAGVSGAHLNPAVTLALAVFRGFPWRKVAPYMLVQTAGAFVGAALVFWNYHPAFLKVDPGLDHTAGIFTTFPAFPEILSARLLDQTI